MQKLYHLFNKIENKSNNGKLEQEFIILVSEFKLRIIH